MHQRFAMTVADNHVITVRQLLSILQVPDQNFYPLSFSSCGESTADIARGTLPPTSRRCRALPVISTRG